MALQQRLLKMHSISPRDSQRSMQEITDLGLRFTGISAIRVEALFLSLGLGFQKDQNLGYFADRSDRRTPRITSVMSV